jgi:hypothetical protein
MAGRVRGICGKRLRQNDCNAFQIFQNVIVPKSQDGKSLSAKPGIARSI